MCLGATCLLQHDRAICMTVVFVSLRGRNSPEVHSLQRHHPVHPPIPSSLPCIWSKQVFQNSHQRLLVPLSQDLLQGPEVEHSGSQVSGQRYVHFKPSRSITALVGPLGEATTVHTFGAPRVNPELPGRSGLLVLETSETSLT